MRQLTPALAAPIGLAIAGVGLALTVLHPFGQGDALDAAQGLVVGIGFGVTIVGFWKGRRAPTA